MGVQSAKFAVRNYTWLIQLFNLIWVRRRRLVMIQAQAVLSLGLKFLALEATSCHSEAMTGWH